MRSDTASFVTKLFLFYYKEKWILKTKRKYIIQARKYINMFWFTDDLATISGGDFETVYQENYAPKLQLKRKNRSYTDVSLLYLDIKILNENFL